MLQSLISTNLERGILSFSPDPSAFPICDPSSPTEPAACSDNVALSLGNFYLGNFFPLVLTGNTNRTTYNNGLSFFGQDDFRLAPNFTLNLGRRWEYFGPLSEKNNLLSNVAADGTLAMIGTHGLDGVYERDLNIFGPRVGFAWSARPNTVMRGGYGLYYDYVPQDLLIANFTTSAGVATNPVGPVPVFPMNPDSSAFNGTNPGAPIFSVNHTGPFAIFAVPRKFATPYTKTGMSTFSRNLLTLRPWRSVTYGVKERSWFACTTPTSLTLILISQILIFRISTCSLPSALRRITRCKPPYGYNRCTAFLDCELQLVEVA